MGFVYLSQVKKTIRVLIHELHHVDKALGENGTDGNRGGPDVIALFVIDVCTSDVPSVFTEHGYCLWTLFVAVDHSKEGISNSQSYPVSTFKPLRGPTQYVDREVLFFALRHGHIRKGQQTEGKGNSQHQGDSVRNHFLTWTRHIIATYVASLCIYFEV